MAFSYFLVAGGIFLAKFIGLFRDIIFASVFGTSAISDIYFQIFGIVTLIFTGIGVALQTMLIKNLNKEGINTKEGQEIYTRKFVSRISAILIAVIAVLYIFARPFTKMLLPEVSGEIFEIAVKITYLMLPSLWGAVVAYIVSGALQNRQIFFVSSIISLPYNAVVLAALFLNVTDIYVISLITTIGWLLQVIIQMPWFYKSGYRMFVPKKNESPLLAKGTANQEILWIFISNMMFQLCFLIDKTFVSGETGMIASINYASNLFIQISGVFVVAMSTVVFPSISKDYEKGDIPAVRSHLRYIITVMAAIFFAMLLTASCFSEQVIRLIYERGEFTAESTATTALIFAIYCFGVFGYVAQEQFNKILYLGNRYKYTVIGTVAVVLLKFMIDMSTDNVVVIASSTSVLLTIYALYIAFAIKKVVGNYLNREIMINVLKVLSAGLCAIIVFVCFKVFAPAMLTGKLSFFIPLGCCGIVYVATLYLTGIIKVILRKEKNENETA